jgi:hypothetical protein
MMHRTPLIAAAMIALVAAGPAAAKTLTFRATLGGTKPPAMTGSPASGTALVKLDTKTHKVSVDLDVRGVTIEQLNKGLIGKPVGPVHFHQYRTADDVELLLPLPYGATYKATKDGFRVTVRDYDYDKGIKLAGATAPFDEFADAMRAGKIVLNVHTEKFPEGEISGAMS